MDTGKDGVEVAMIIEPQKGKLDEALNLVRRHHDYGIEGFRYEVKVLRTGEEANQMIGLWMPAVQSTLQYHPRSSDFLPLFLFDCQNTITLRLFGRKG